jgi:hypothetical protein
MYDYNEIINEFKSSLNDDELYWFSCELIEINNSNYTLYEKNILIYSVIIKMDRVWFKQYIRNKKLNNLI